MCGAIHPASVSYNRNPRSSSSASSTFAVNSSVHGRGSSINARERLLSMRHRVSYMFHRCLLQCRTYNCTLVGILNICVFCIFFCVPAYLYPSVEIAECFNFTTGQHTIVTNGTPEVVNRTKTWCAYTVTQSELNKKTNNTIFKVTFYTQAILGKFIPCILLVTFSGLLIHSLVVINQNNKVGVIENSKMKE